MEHFFEKQDVVEIKQGVIDLESGVELGGWRGRIVEILEDEEGNIVAYIRWDSATLQTIPDFYFEYCKNNQISGVDIIVGVENLAPAHARDTIDEANWERTHLLAKYHWPQMGNSTEAILAILEAHKKKGGSVLQAWEEYLNMNLAFPITAEIKSQEKSTRRKRHKCIVHSLNGSEDTYGVFVLAKVESGMIILPLTNIRVAPNSEAYPIFENYQFWYDNQ